MYALMRWLMRLVTQTVLFGGLFKVVGVENVPRTGALLVCPNHVSTVDPPLVPAYLPRDDSWNLAKSEHFESWFGRWLFSNYHAFPIVRHSADRKALRRARKLLEEGHALIVYPEGTRVRQGGLKEPEPGAGFLALLTRSPVQPVGLVGTRECFPTGALIPRRRPVTLIFGRPFRIATRHADGTRVTNAEAADAIMLAIAELLPPELRGKFSDAEGLRARLGELFEYLEPAAVA